MSDNARGPCEPFCRKHLTRRTRRTTEQHGAGSDDKSPQAVLQQPRMEIEQQAEAQAAHAEVRSGPGRLAPAGYSQQL